MAWGTATGSPRATPRVTEPREPEARSGRSQVLRFLSRIWIRLFAFNALLVFLPAAGLLYLDDLEEALLRQQEDAMAQEGRLLAAALSHPEGLDSEAAQALIQRLQRRTTSRLRVLDRSGQVLADSAALGPRRDSEPVEDGSETEETSARSDWAYRLGRVLYQGFDALRRPTAPSPDPGRDDAGPERLLDRFEVREAMDGDYGAAVRPTPGQRSLTLSSGLPIHAGTGEDAPVVGVALVSRSTYRILQALYGVRLTIFQVVLASVAAAVVLSLLVATTIVRPLGRLRGEAAALLDRRGRLTGRFQGSRKLDEIGDLSRALEELTRRLEGHLKDMESFAGEISHELKNPLASIRNAAELAQDLEEPEEQRRFLERIQGQVARMEHLLSGAREVAAIDAQLEVEERRPVDLGRLLEEIVEGYRLRGAEPVRLELDCPRGECRVEAVPERLAQLFENLLDNALSFSPAGAEVRVTLVGSPGSRPVVLTVEDSGPGIPEAHRERIFDRFFSYRPQGDDEESEDLQAPHSGFGLAVARTIAEGYGGSVGAESSKFGGALFRVELPAAPAETG